MPNFNEKVDAYIERAQPFAQPILEHIRELVHKACPDVEEKIKWSMPFFDYKGKMMCHMAGFKQHCAFGFFQAALMDEPMLIQNAESESAMGHLGRISSLKDLPSDKKIIGFIKKAMQITDEGRRLVKKPVAKSEYIVPAYIAAAIKKNKKAFATFEAFAPSHRKEYATWIDEAKTEETKNKRIAQAIEWMVEGKPRNWKYAKK
jgi:uncharacterized protein YdeI (YjbR/CyaY-like superfamily)